MDVKRNFRLAKQATDELQRAGFKVVCPAAQWHYKLGSRWQERKRSYRGAIKKANIVIILMHGIQSCQTALDYASAKELHKPIVFADFDNAVGELMKLLERNKVLYGTAAE
jgi:hypothetical protein